MNGAVQGLATTTASTPVKKLPLRPPRLARPLPAFMTAAAELHQSGQGQAHGDKQVGQGDDKARRLQLEAPADGAAGLLQCDQHGGHQHETGNDAGGIDPAVQVPVVVRAARKAQYLQRQNGEYTGHQVENGAPYKGQRQHIQQGPDAAALLRLCGVPPALPAVQAVSRCRW